MYDITDSNSFELIKNLINNLSEKSYLKKIIISNKNDLESNRNVSYLELKEFLKKNNLLNFDISILHDTNIVELVKNIYKYVNEKNNELNNNKISESLIELKKYDFNNLIKIILLGESEVGKTALFKRYFNNSFKINNNLATIGMESETKFILINKDICKLTIFDTAGQEKFRAVPRNYYKNADGILLLFDVCNRNSFDKIKDWINEIKIHSNKSINNDDDKNKLIVYLLGNKIDMERDVNKKEGEKMANELKIKYFEISCKTSINVNEVINRLIIECYNSSSNESNSIKIGSKKESKNKHVGCCLKK
jgi:Ras-related protein Rab-1A